MNLEEQLRIVVEVNQKTNSLLDAKLLQDKVVKFLKSDRFPRKGASAYILDQMDYEVKPLCEDLVEHVNGVVLSASRGCRDLIEKSDVEDFEDDFSKANFKVYVFRLIHDAVVDGESIGDDGEELPPCTHMILPSMELHEVWENLIFDTDIKNELLNFVMTSLYFASKNVNPKVISWNKVVLLHGPAGTGKTSLCKGLAQKLSIRLQHRFQSCQLIEINSHSLFSRWFSESGKLVMKLFSKIREYIEEQNLVFLLIDEVESLAHNRQGSAEGNDPSDAIRVVNALLTQIDSIKNYPNVIILTTSNITGAIDLAFVDRADIKMFVDHPSEAGIYEILRGCIEELVRSELIAIGPRILTYRSLCDAMGLNESTFIESHRLLKIARKSIGFSGRTLKKLPFLAVALFAANHSPLKLMAFLNNLEKAVARQQEERAILAK